MAAVCSICRSPDRSAVDSLLDQGSTTRFVAGQSKFSQSTVARHSAHRADKDRAQHRLVQLARPAPTPEQIPPAHKHSPVGRFAARLQELAEATSRVAEYAAASRDPRLMLSALKAESEQLHRLGQAFPADPKVLFDDGKQRALDVVSKIIYREVSDTKVQARIRSSINAELISSGLEDGTT